MNQWPAIQNDVPGLAKQAIYKNEFGRFPPYWGDGAAAADLRIVKQRHVRAEAPASPGRKSPLRKRIEKFRMKCVQQWQGFAGNKAARSSIADQLVQNDLGGRRLQRSSGFHHRFEKLSRRWKGEIIENQTGDVKAIIPHTRLRGAKTVSQPSHPRSDFRRGQKGEKQAMIYAGARSGEFLMNGHDSTPFPGVYPTIRTKQEHLPVFLGWKARPRLFT
jgi:hypothetical protein